MKRQRPSKGRENQPQFLASFGRTRGRKLPEHKQELLQTLLPQLQLDPKDMPAVTALAKRHPKIWMEIGFGGGEHVAEQTKRNPDVLYLACETYLGGVASLLEHLDKSGARNLRIINEDARLLLEALPDHSVERLFILFPDPWPKLRHHKRRIVAEPTLSLIARVLKKGGELRLATDHADYAVWMLEHVLAHGGFEWQAKSQSDWLEAPADWVVTRYQTKARAEGRAPVFYLFRKS